MTDVGDCFAVTLAHTDESIGSETVIFRVKAKTLSTVTYAMQKGDEDEIAYAPQNVDDIVRATVQVGLMQYFFFLGGAQSDGQQLMEDRTAWQTMTVQKETVDTQWVAASVNLDFDIGEELVFHTAMQVDDDTGLFEAEEFTDPWTEKPSDVTSVGVVNPEVPGIYAVEFSRSNLTKQRTVVVPYAITDLKKIHAVNDVGANNNTTDFRVAVAANQTLRISSSTLHFTKTSSNGIIIKPLSGSGTTSVTISN
jgi:hypothetical protein